MERIDRSIVIFGAGSGIGLSAATLAAAEGYRVLVADKSPAASALPVVNQQGCGFALCDAGDPEAVAAVLERASREHGKLDAVVTTVGGAFVRPQMSLDLDYWNRDIAFNLNTAYVVATLAVEAMKKKGGGGAVVTTSSSFASVTAPDRIAYCAAKAGVIALTKNLAMSAAKFGVRVNCVSPGATETERLRRMVGADLEKVRASTPQGRIATPDDAAHAILFLVSDRASSITGQVINVNNGSYMP
jgi:NAD(P)-dependent dehydrogenase (short-subunit alcohol dehydrogenase family)